jgi:AraC family transcriptional regulator
MALIEQGAVCGIIHGRAYRYIAEDCPGWLSVKCMFAGRAHYKTASARYAVDQDAYLILNDKQMYTIEIDSPIQVESFCVFFDSGAAAELLRSLTSSSNVLIDAVSVTQPVHFSEQLYPHDSFMTPTLLHMREHSQAGTVTRNNQDELAFRLLEGLCYAHYDVLGQIERMPMIRAATRAELFKRLHLARDYMDACLSTAMTLNDVAGIACLSKHHFLRTFRATFGVTPHQYVTGKRLRYATQLLASTDIPVADVCMEVGFESSPSFSTLFRRCYGLSPEAYRKISNSR